MGDRRRCGAISIPSSVAKRSCESSMSSLARSSRPWTGGAKRRWQAASWVAPREPRRPTPGRRQRTLRIIRAPEDAAMRGLMMDRPLLLGHFLERAEKLYPRREIVSLAAQGLHRTSYGELGRRVRRLASALAKLGLDPGDRVGTFSWNHYRHL